MKFGSSALAKGLMVALVAILVLIPVQMLGSLVQERTEQRRFAVASVARGWGGEQFIGGPILAIPMTVTTDEGRSAVVDWYVLPESLTLESELKVLDERRKLGVYEVPVYTTTVHAVASFDVASKIAAKMQSPRATTVHLDRARLLVPISDARGVRDARVSGAAALGSGFEPENTFVMSALATPLKSDAEIDKTTQRFDLTLEVAGTYALKFMPTARSTSVKLLGNWADPGFTSGFLPTERTIEKNGRFDARWQVLDLNRAYGSQWVGNQVSDQVLKESAFGVDLVQTVDLYQRAERSVKYAGLFIALSLLTLFVWEHLSGRALHPIQYGLMGLALSVFYLLLLALAEHIGFFAAYIIAAVALCGLLGFYLAGAFDSSKSGIGAGGVFAGVYALLYLLVTSEDYSLLVGSICSVWTARDGDGAHAKARLVPGLLERAWGLKRPLRRRAAEGNGRPRVSTIRQPSRASAITSGITPSQNIVRTMISLDPPAAAEIIPTMLGPHCRNDAPDVVAKALSPSRAGAREQLRQIEHERAEHAVDPDAHAEEHPHPRLGRQIQSERREQHDGRVEEVHDEHRSPPHHIGERDCGQRADESAEVEPIRRLRLPRFAQHARGFAGDAVLSGVLRGQRAAEQGNKGVAGPPGDERRDGCRQPAHRVLANRTGEQLSGCAVDSTCAPVFSHASLSLMKMRASNATIYWREPAQEHVCARNSRASSPSTRLRSGSSPCSPG